MNRENIILAKRRIKQLIRLYYGDNKTKDFQIHKRGGGNHLASTETDKHYWGIRFQTNGIIITRAAIIHGGFWSGTYPGEDFDVTREIKAKYFEFMYETDDGDIVVGKYEFLQNKKDKKI